ncbi:MAG TPA: diguanylate cyclase [Steroidobacteraceae bacterium]|jgi:two-component system cell cycle response regulator|nr:diguanylate cyclase [Steroidobacteraceae bacterium]
MRSGGHTTVIRRVLERRAQKIPTADDGTTTATVAVMVRVLPPPKALLVFADQPLRLQMERHFTPDVLDCDSVADEQEALRRFAAEFRPLVITDSPELIRTLRARTTSGRAPFILYVAELDEAQEREAGLLAGADDCIGRRVSAGELDARIAAARRIAELEGVLRITLAENRRLSATDDLTRVASRRFFGKHFPREVERAARYGLPLALILCDIDHFKQINDTEGHSGGDQILRQFGPRLKQALRRHIDWVARIGGEEFAIVMPETNYERALEVARKLRRAVVDTSFTLDKKKLRLSASFGLCGIDRVPVGESRLAQRILRIADAALYRSKDDGRNRVTATTLAASGPAPRAPD